MPSTTPTQPISGTDRLRIAAHVRLTYDPARERHVLLSPEAVAVLNGTGVAVLRLCDGTRTVAEIVAGLRCRYDRVDDAEVQRFLGHLAARRYVEAAGG
jgi:pyrroloquinoline quinone biosynthesis protein D